MNDADTSRFRNEAILAARILLMLLFVISGWGKLTNFGGTMAYFTSDALPAPALAAVIAIVMEFVVGLAIMVGFYTRPLALLILVYTFATALIGHQFWSMEGAARVANAINFYKNLGLMGGMLLLYVAGAGRYAIDARLGRSQAALHGPAGATHVGG